MNSATDADATFHPQPPELIFRDFIPPQTYKLPLQLFNNDKISRQVKVEQRDSPNFRVVGSGDTGCKVAPGMTATFNVFFTPHEEKDYYHRVVVVTDRGRFDVPIRAIGPRALLDFRDEIRFPACPVKASTLKTQLVRNKGKSQAKFRLQTQRPFSVSPCFGTLDVGDSVQVTVDFHPMTVGDHRQDLLLHYHTGEDVRISLCGTCKELNLNLQPECVKLTDTYISLTSAHTVSLENSSSITLRYYWTTCPSQQERENFQKKLELEREQSLMECKPDVTGSDSYTMPSTVEGVQAVKDHLLTLPGSYISIEPKEGEIWPKTSAKFNIVFKPKEARFYEHTIYCDITGHESWLPLTISGDGIGPQLQLNYNMMDMKNLFIGDKNSYEVTMSNKGLIDATFNLSFPDTVFGRCFSFSPHQGVVPIGGCQVVHITFQSFTLGTFSEDMCLAVTGQPQPSTLNFRGSVIGPTFHLNVSELNFGDVAFGFPLTLIFTLFNTSLVPMTFSLRVPGDGLGPPSLDSVKQISELSRNHWQGSDATDSHSVPEEFTFNPVTATVRPLSDVDMKVTLCSNTMKTYDVSLVVDVEGVGEEIMSLPIKARCVVPELLLETPVLDFERCLLSHSYEQKVRLFNASALPACYGLLEQEYEERPSLSFGSSTPRGIILPHSSAEIPLNVVASAAGRLHRIVHIAVFGSAQPPLELIVSCIGQGPTVHVKSSQINFGKIPVLTDVTKTLHLLNQSPIPAYFTANMASEKSQWWVEPLEGKVPPEGQLELRVVGHLRDTVHFRDKLEIAIRDSQTHVVELSATGSGNTIVTDLPFAPSVDLGTYFSHGSVHYKFKMTNKGQRRYLMYWRAEGAPGFFKPAKGVSKSSKEKDASPIMSPQKSKDVSSCGSSLPSEKDGPVFTLTPGRVELFPGCSVDMLLTGASDCPKTVHERLECYGIVGLQGCNERLMTVDITCHFVTPKINIFPTQLDFYMEKVPEKSLVPQYKKLLFSNASSIALHMDLSVIEPFSLCSRKGDVSSATTMSLLLDDGKQAELWVCFSPSHYQDKLSHVVYESLHVRYRGHPREDEVELHSEVHLPNLRFSSTIVDFGCVLNCTETQKQVTITNCSPLPVSYRWTFLVNQNLFAIRQLDSPVPSAVDERSGIAEIKIQRSRSPKKPSTIWSAPQTPSIDFDDQTKNQHLPLSVEEVFDILPIHGYLDPGGKQLVAFSFYGHTNISTEVVALCHVEEGPIYEITLKGEASEISYTLNTTHIDFGQQLFDRVAEAKVILTNTGKVDFRFCVLQPPGEGTVNEEEVGRVHIVHEKRSKLEGEEEISPGQPMVIPSTGFVPGNSEYCLRILYLPGVPEVFERRLQLQVACSPPHDITVCGEGIFPRISLNLPRNLPEEQYGAVVQLARTALEAQGRRWKHI